MGLVATAISASYTGCVIRIPLGRLPPLSFYFLEIGGSFPKALQRVKSIHTKPTPTIEKWTSNGTL